jgi:hypothetical protein
VLKLCARRDVAGRRDGTHARVGAQRRFFVHAEVWVPA